MANATKDGLQPLLERFGDLLDVRLGRGAFTTEDSVRYTFFCSLLETSRLRPEDIVLEYPHPAIVGAQVDLWAADFPGGGLAVEFKYDRAIPSGKNAPRPQKAGKAIHDLCRLGKLPRVMERVFVYATDAEMASYFAKPSNGLVDLFDLSVGSSVAVNRAFIAERSKTLRDSIGYVPDVVATMLLRRQLPSSHELRVFGVVGRDESQG